ncbi:phosphotransferase [Brachybacterium sp. EF45031]|uniref:phosphotransferase family protein n=1 Tax=Brachybacterium sillae TaxID=2810536 RepID=UPI00217E2C77|nr:phosphotransferase [Brachybacterium sillae]MCS6711349.1 phosphotransferase [Brachybacterium sillae]
MIDSLDGSELLTGPAAGDLLRSAVVAAGGTLHRWDLDHVDHRPGRSTTALYRATVSWPRIDGAGSDPRQELFGASAHLGEPETPPHAEDRSLVMTNGDMDVRVWRYPHDPWLPYLSHVCFPDAATATLQGVLGSVVGPVASVEVIAYRPGRRAVLRADLAGRRVYLKVLPPGVSADMVHRHATLHATGVPAPTVLGHRDGLVVSAELPGISLSEAVQHLGPAACRPEDLVAVLDRLPAVLVTAPARPPWSASADFYAGIVARSVPALAPRALTIAERVRAGLDEAASRVGSAALEVVHGDFYEAQVMVADGRVTGLLDVDTVGPGRRADDLACLLAHLSVLGLAAPGAREALRAWWPVLAARVDRRELQVRTAGVALSLATGPHRLQEPAWEGATERILTVAEQWLDAAQGGPLASAP